MLRILGRRICSIVKEGIKVMNVTERLASGTGKKVGAYRLETGEIIYVPEGD